MNRLLIFLMMVSPVVGAQANQDWLRQVSPIMSSAEMARYRSLSPSEQAAFQNSFWQDKAISPGDYFDRLSKIDTQFGSGKQGSGLNTDQGRVYLSLGPPNRVTRLPSSRTFFPLEIWYYESIPQIGLSSELRLIFYLKNGLGFYKLYSPTLDTIRALLTPQANTIGMFGPNQEITQADLQTQLTTRPAENEVAEAAVSVSPGIMNEGNEEILSKILSPALVLSKPLHPDVHSRFLLAHEGFTSVLANSPYGGTQADLSFLVSAWRDVSVEVRQAGMTIYQNHVHLGFQRQQSIQYVNRLDLLKGRYTILVSADDSRFAYPLTINGSPEVTLYRAASCSADSRGNGPFIFSGECLAPASDGSRAVFVSAAGRRVTWRIYSGSSTLWKTTTEPAIASVIDVPLHDLAAGSYELEATDGDQTRSIGLELKPQAETQSVVVSYNANLAPGLRLAFIGHQWLLRGDIARAQAAIKSSLAAMPSGNDEAWIVLSRAEALAGQYDDARAVLKPILDAKPKNVEALVTLAFIETKLQDFPVAANLYRRALTLRDTPEIRLALDTVANK